MDPAPQRHPHPLLRRPRRNTRGHGRHGRGKALADAGVAPDEVDQILVATMSDVGTAGTGAAAGGLAAEIARRLGTAAPAEQVSAACAGFTVGLSLATASVASGQARTCLVIGVERMSDILDPTDRSTAFLFADGAGAALVGRGTEPGIGTVVWGTDPALREAITVREEPGRATPSSACGARRSSAGR